MNPPSPIHASDHMTVHELAAQLSCGDNDAEELMASGRLSGAKRHDDTRHWVAPRASVEAYLATRSPR